MVPGGVALAPVTITPTKPLTPTHVKGLLWLDVMHKGTSRIADTTYVWNPRMSNLTAQTVAFWAYLDRVVGDADWASYDEARLGELYVRSHRETPEKPSAAELAPYVRRVEAEGWIHPASRRLIDLWRAQLDLLDVTDPGLDANRPLGLGAEETLDLLAARGLLIDHRRVGGPAYLDGALWGMPLRQLVGEDGHINYLLPVLRELVPLVELSRRIVLVYDQELNLDYVLLHRVLELFGGDVARLALRRVPLDGVVQSSRYGGWEGSTLADLSAACLEHVDLPTYRLGMRLYFIGVLERDSPQSFRPDLLRRSMTRARRLLPRAAEDGGGAAPGDDPAEFREFLTGLVGDGGYVDPYRLTTALLDRRRRVPVGRLLRTVFA